MNPLYAKAVVLTATVAMVIIRAPYGQKSRSVKVARSFRGALELALLTVAWVAFFVPFFWLFSGLFDFAEYALSPAALVPGVACLAASLWLFRRSHEDLGTQWSISLELREQHQLVTRGVYRRVRHPMYLSLLLYGLGQALVLPNAVVGPSYIAAMVLLFALRLNPEERMMRDHFGAEYDAYAASTRRLVPGVW